MVWNSVWPDGTKSVKQNTPTGQQNTAYTETNLNKDHFWNIGVDEDGHHRAVQTVATNDADKTIQTNIELATGMDGVFYSRFKTALESTVQQDCQPFFKNIAGDPALYLKGVMQLLGIRACALIKVIPPGGVFTTTYSHNCTVTRDASGKFHLNFTNTLPSDQYLALGGCVFSKTSADSGFVSTKPSSNASGNDVKSTSQYFFNTMTESSNITDPIQAWVVVFGG